MASVVGIRYRKAGRVYYFDPSGIELGVSDMVVVDTNRGQVLGQVVMAPTEIMENEISKPLKSVVRKATEEDIEHNRDAEEKEENALKECSRLVKELNLPMKLITADYNLDNSRVTIYFGAEKRVDFRDLVRELGKVLKVRVELRQVGPRDEAKLIGGYGRCGRNLCCQSFLTEFSPVSIKMAKEQNLPLSSMKISGSCGRLLCCLGYEYEQYRNINKKMPKKGKTVQTDMGEAIVIGTNPLEEMVSVELAGGATAEIPIDRIKTEKEAGIKEEKTKTGTKSEEDKS